MAMESRGVGDDALASDRLLVLMQLGDSALPTGGYAFSSGLEAAWQLGLVEDGGDLHQFVGNVLRTSATGEIPFLRSACRLSESPDAGLPIAALSELVQHYDAMQTAASLRQASLKLGRSWLRLYARLFPSEQLRIEDYFAGGVIPPHFCVAFGLTLSAAGIGEDAIVDLFLHQTLRDQLAAAVRLGILGPFEAVERHAALRSACREAAEKSRHVPFGEAYRGAPQLDLAQGFHAHLYSRLFQS